jgi:hypothetical protein
LHIESENTMIANIECEICLEVFTSDSVSMVNCGSTVPHNLCYFCEGEWRSKMPLQENGMRIMKCPTCRGPEQDRTKESLEREVIRLNRLLADTANLLSVSTSLLAAENMAAVLPPSVRRPRTVPRVPLRSTCASGRDCHHGIIRTRSLTHLKCHICSVVFCCRKCRTCVGCVPI